MDHQPDLHGVASLISSGRAGESMIKSTTPPTRSVIARGLPRLQPPVSHRRRHLMRPARDTPGHTRSEPPQCGVTPNDAAIMPALVPKNLRHHDIPCAAATPSANGRSSQLCPPGGTGRLEQLTDWPCPLSDGGIVWTLRFSVGWTAETGHQNTRPIPLPRPVDAATPRHQGAGSLPSR